MSKQRNKKYAFEFITNRLLTHLSYVNSSYSKEKNVRVYASSVVRVYASSVLRVYASNIDHLSEGLVTPPLRAQVEKIFCVTRI